jgi:hypothetical protein
MVSGVDGGPSNKSGPGAGAGGGVRDTNIVVPSEPIAKIIGIVGLFAVYIHISRFFAFVYCIEDAVIGTAWPSVH